MRIRKIGYDLIESQRKEPFVIATGSSDVARNVIVKIFTDEYIGIGNACPNSVTGDTHETIQMSLKIFADELVDEDPEDIEGINNKMDDILERNPSAKAGVDIALYDMMAKKNGQPVFEIFGKNKDKVLTDMTIGIMATKDAVEHAVHYKEMGFKALKIKIGLDKDEDIKRIGMIREVLGEDMIIRVDANQGYDVKTAQEVLSQIESFNIEQVEQPVKWDDIWGLKEVKENSSIPITADETVKTIEDARIIIENECADNINIKLMKCGGLTRAIEINRIASENGIPTMIGCMAENRISIAAGLHFALSQKNVKYADLDSHFSFLDENITGGFTFEDGYLVPKMDPGLGTEMVK